MKAGVIIILLVEELIFSTWRTGRRL